MNEYDVTKLPFTSISRENWQMLKDLDADTLYDVIQNVSEYVLTGEKCDCDNTLSRVVCNQLINVIDRKGQKSHNSSKNLPDKSKKVEEKKPEMQRWLEAIRDGKSPGEYQLFDGYWNRFFKNREEAKKYVQDYLKQFKKNIAL